MLINKYLPLINFKFKILILVFCFYSLSVLADNISDLQIEGMSIGDSLLNFFSESEIKESIIDYPYKDDEFIDVEIYDNRMFKTYEGMQITFKRNDNKFIIYGLTGFNFYDENIDECFNKVDVVSKEVNNLFKNTERENIEQKHKGDPSGESIIKAVEFWFDNNDVVTVECWNWSSKMTEQYKYTDNFGVSILHNDLVYWLNNIAY